MDISAPSRFRVNKESLAWVLFLFLLASLALYYFSFIDNSWAPTPDSAYYVSLAESLVHGKGYTFGGQPHVKYPPDLSDYMKQCNGIRSSYEKHPIDMEVSQFMYRMSTLNPKSLALLD